MPEGTSYLYLPRDTPGINPWVTTSDVSNDTLPLGLASNMELQVTTLSRDFGGSWPQNTSECRQARQMLKSRNSLRREGLP